MYITMIEPELLSGRSSRMRRRLRNLLPDMVEEFGVSEGRVKI